jgi:hypothetical protein
MSGETKLLSAFGRYLRSSWIPRIAAFAIPCFIATIFASAVQLQKQDELPDTTEDHVAAAGWWPTKAAASANRFAGESACGKCHFQEALTQADTLMAKAASRGTFGDTDRQELLPGSFESTPYLYRLLAENDGWSIEVESGGQSLSYKIIWTFGANHHGQTYLLENGGALYESQVSGFPSIHRLDLTPGHIRAESGSLQGAIGYPMSSARTMQCFGCHTTASLMASGFNTANAIPGVHCEACHGPGMNHVNAAMAGRIEEARKAILNPAHLIPSDSIDFCGACHKTAADILLDEEPQGLSSIRYQPYRLEKSRCWQKTEDARLTCVACHNPHEPLVREEGFYDRKCLSCHSRHEENTAGPSSQPPAICPKATANCTSCHMPKYNLPEMHSQFTDHFIRIVRSRSPYPS